MVSFPLYYKLYRSSVAVFELLFVYNQITRALSFLTNILYMHM